MAHGEPLASMWRNSQTWLLHTAALPPSVTLQTVRLD